MDSTAAALKKISDAKIMLLARSPFWATLVLNTPIEVSEVPPSGLSPGQAWTAATDGLRILVNPAFINALPTKQCLFLLAHECGHIMFEHSLRVELRDRALWNAAADYVINNILVEDGMEMIPGGLLDENYTSTTEIVYAQLQKEGKSSNDNGSKGIGQDILPGPKLSAAEQAEQTQQVKQLVAQAAMAGRLAGKMSATLERLVGDTLHSQVAWPDLLRAYMQDVSQSNETWARRSRRFSDVYLPSRHSLELGAMCVIVDTSASISPDELRLALSEVRAIADQLRPSSIRIISADTAVASDTELLSDDPLPTKFAGGGGTDMRVPLEYVEQYEPCVSILFTDGETPWPSVEPPYPLIVCCSTDVVPPVGRLVRVRT